jgi:hypothetical protein
MLCLKEGYILLKTSLMYRTEFFQCLFAVQFSDFSLVVGLNECVRLIALVRRFLGVELVLMSCSLCIKLRFTRENRGLKLSESKAHAL